MAIVELGAIAAQGFATLVAELLKSAISEGHGDRRKPPPVASLNFEMHLKQTYDRCTKIKTLLSRDTPIDLLSQYVSLRFVRDNIVMDDYSLIDEIWQNTNCVMTGTAGGGKTIFMRYFWIACFVRPRGKIPLYIELRRLNDLTSEDLLTYLFHESVSGSESGIRDAFDATVKAGRFIFIFDGFDEVQEEKRESVEKNILRIARLNAGNICVVSGRPDDRFGAWQDFTTYKVAPLDKEQVVELIEKVEFDRLIKKKFIQRIKSDLYDRHQSFLSVPLLASIMLLTFEAYADIPEKIHVFYDQAFDVLFAKHDASKEAYRRRKHTEYPIDQFKRYFSYFCLLSYNKQKHAFSEGEVLELIRESATLVPAHVDEVNFMKDLMESVCMLQWDGLHIIFTHRSFQEYFTSYCMARMPSGELGHLLGKFSARLSDNVLSMLFDMNPDLVEENYVFPMFSGIETQLEHVVENFSFEAMCVAFELDAELSMEPVGHDDIIPVMVYSQSGILEFFFLLSILYPMHFEGMRGRIKDYREKDRAAALKSLQRVMSKGSGVHKSKATRMRGGLQVYQAGVWQLSEKEMAHILPWVEKRGYVAFWRDKLSETLKLWRNLKVQRMKRDQSMDRLLRS